MIGPPFEEAIVALPTFPALSLMITVCGLGKKDVLHLTPSEKTSWSWAGI
jgi:hypothetical protein